MIRYEVTIVAIVEAETPEQAMRTAIWQCSAANDLCTATDPPTLFEIVEVNSTLTETDIPPRPAP